MDFEELLPAVKPPSARTERELRAKGKTKIDCEGAL